MVTLGAGESVWISGASGLVGGELARKLRAAGTPVRTFVRRDPRDPSEIRWEQGLELPPGPTASAVVHLAGEPVVGIWTAEKRRRIRESRVLRTAELARVLAQQHSKPRVLVCASAIGFYGSRGDEVLIERSGPGSGFLADACVEWENATSAARQAGIRVVNLRIGVVLSTKGGALKAMLPAFRLGLGARLADGRHWMSWITLDDLVRVIEFVIANKDIHGPVNCTAPNPVTNAEFSRTLAYVLRRPMLLAVPRFIVKLAPGGMADEALLSSERVMPEKLMRAGFDFQDPQLALALAKILRS